MNNFPFEHEGKTLWYSRSVACSMYLFIREKSTYKWFVLVSQRGHGAQSNIDKWNVPGGYLDFNETLEMCARRECYEETGVLIDGEVDMASVNTNIYSKTQNVVCSFYRTMEVDNIEEIKSQFSFERNETNEVSNIDLIEVKWFFENPVEAAEKFAFGHDRMIREIFSKRVDISSTENWLINKIKKWTKIECPIN